MSIVDPRSKKYYWLKLEKDFFKRHDIKVIESLDNGKDYLIFYMKLLLESVSHHGLLRFNDTVPYNDKMLATITNTNIDIVRSAVNIFTELDLMSILDDETIYMKEVEKRMGQETGFAVEKRRKRLLEKEEKRQIETMSHNNSNSISYSNSISNSNKEVIKEVIDIFNNVCGTNLTYRSKNNNSLINARIEEGAKVEDFEKVIRSKYNEWEDNEKMKAYIRPSTLFGATNFHNYLAAAQIESRNKEVKPKKKEYEFNLS